MRFVNTKREVDGFRLSVPMPEHTLSRIQQEIPFETPEDSETIQIFFFFF